MQLPLHQFGALGSMDELVFVAGAARAPSVSAPLALHFDDIWFSAAAPPNAGDFPPSYGRLDMNAVQSSWLSGVARKGAASGQLGKTSKSPHFCEYMSSGASCA